MCKILSVVFILISFSSLSFAAPYKCDRLGVFEDKNVCNSYCSITCNELAPKGTGGTCDKNKYKNFVYVNDKTYAITKSPVTWSSENTVSIRNDSDNKIIASLLKSAGISEAWIGIYDPSQSSTAYNTVDPTRFKNRSGQTPSYTSWKNGQPDNALNSSAIGNSPLYGEYWAVIDQRGEWSDLGLNSDGSAKLLHAVVEWDGELSCVAGKDVISSDDRPSGMVCGKEDTKLGFNFQTCSEGNIFGSSSNGFLCPIDKMECKKNIRYYIGNKNLVFTGSLPNVSMKNLPAPTRVSNRGAAIVIDQQTSYVEDFTSRLEGGEFISSRLDIGTFTNSSGGKTTGCTGNPLSDMQSCNIDTKWIESTVPYTFTVTVATRIEDVSYTCPYSGKSCIESDGGYYCSPVNCADGGASGSYEESKDETPEGSNDADNNGATDADGNCLGTIKIFPGRDSRCRIPGTQSKFFQCCKVLKPEDANKPDIIIFPDILDFKICNGTERQLAINRANDMCVEIGQYCTEKWQGSGCVQYKKTYCCFDSDFARAFAEAGMDMLNKSWGKPESPYCGGFTTEEMQYLNGAGITNHPKLKQYGDKLGKDFQDKLMNEFENNFDKDAIGNQIKNQVEGLKK